MTNLEKMKKSMISQIESMDLLQFYNVLLSFEELNFDQQFRDNYGIDMDAINVVPNTTAALFRLEQRQGMILPYVLKNSRNMPIKVSGNYYSIILL